MKNQLDKRIDLEGEWEVELSSISLPHDSVKCIVDIGSTFGSHFSTDKTSQFHVIANEEKETFTVSADKIKTTERFSHVSSNTFSSWHPLTQIP